MLVKTTVCVSALTQIDNVTATIIAEKDSRRNILRKRVTLINKLRISVATYELYRFATIERDVKEESAVCGNDRHL